MSANESKRSCGRGSHHSEGLFCIRFHGKQPRFNLLIPRQRGVEFDPYVYLLVTGGWGLVVDVHTLCAQGDETMRAAEFSRTGRHLRIYAGHLRIGDLGVRHLAVVDDVAGEGVLVVGHVHTQE